MKKTRQNNKLEPSFDSIKAGKALARWRRSQDLPENLVISKMRCLEMMVIDAPRPERFRAKCISVRVKKMRQNNKLEPGFDSIKAGKALELSESERFSRKFA